MNEIVDEREIVYGPVIPGMVQIAEVWSGILGTEVRAYHVPLMMIGLKLVRASETPNYSDNSDDIEGYLDIFRQVVGPDMVKARNVHDYIASSGG